MRPFARPIFLAALVAGCGSGNNHTPGDGGSTDLSTGGGDLTVIPDAATLDMAMGPAAAAYEGYWQLTSVTLAGNMPQTLTRASSPSRTLSDYTIGAQDASHLHVAGKLTVITSGS